MDSTIRKKILFLVLVTLILFSFGANATFSQESPEEVDPIEEKVVTQKENAPPALPIAAENKENLTETVIPETNFSEHELICWQPECGTKKDGTVAPFQFFRDGSRLKFHGWVESGLYTNAKGATSQYDADGLMDNSGNGSNHGPGLRTTDYNMNQLWGSLTREMDCENGLDWGFQADMVYGMNGYGVQSTGDDSFDSGWGDGDYGLGFHQMYAELGYKKFTALYGKFGTPIGWESTPSWDNFFYSHSYCFNIEPCTHTGVLLKYQLMDELKLIGGWTAGMENGFANRYGDQSMITGLELALTEKSNIYYYMTQGRLNNQLALSGDDRFGNGGSDIDYFIHSLCFEWLLTDRWTYILQHNLNNQNDANGDRFSAYGINNHLLYWINDKWGVGMRAEWLRDNGVLGYQDASGVSENSDYIQLTLGLNYYPAEHLRIRPEIRYDHSLNNAMFNYGTKNEQFSGGFAVLYGF